MIQDISGLKSPGAVVFLVGAFLFIVKTLPTYLKPAITSPAMHAKPSNSNFKGIAVARAVRLPTD